VIHFRRILEAYDFLKGTEREDEFYSAAQTFVEQNNVSIRRLFDPLAADDKSVATAEALCRDFLNSIRRLKIEHTSKRFELKKVLFSVKQHIEKILEHLED
jgi:hypothetical protein